MPQAEEGLPEKLLSRAATSLATELSQRQRLIHKLSAASEAVTAGPGCRPRTLNEAKKSVVFLNGPPNALCTLKALIVLASATLVNPRCCLSRAVCLHCSLQMRFSQPAQSSLVADILAFLPPSYASPSRLSLRSRGSAPALTGAYVALPLAHPTCFCSPHASQVLKVVDRLESLGFGVVLHGQKYRDKMGTDLAELTQV
eukprot:3804822-Pleurochrysis_carterae.AAC.2